MRLVNLVTKVNAINTSGICPKTQYNAADHEIPDSTWLLKKADYNARITEIEDKITSITDSATASALTTDENEITNIIDLAKKNYNAKISDINPIQYGPFRNCSWMGQCQKRSLP